MVMPSVTLSAVKLPLPGPYAHVFVPAQSVHGDEVLSQLQNGAFLGQYADVPLPRHDSHAAVYTSADERWVGS